MIRGDRGIGLVEAMITASLLVVVSGVIFGTFDAFTRAQHRQEVSVEARQALRQALGEVARDVRAAATVQIDDGRPGRAATFEVTTDDGPTSVQFVADLKRGRLDRNDGSGGRRLVLGGLVDPGSPVLVFRAADGSTLDPSVEDSATVDRCTAVVRISLAVRPAPGAAVLTSSTDVELRNRASEAAGC